jgi:hypothetical protein
MKKFALLLTAAGIGIAGASSVRAASYDLTAPASTATVNGGVYSYITLQPTGTGVFGSFLRLQTKNGQVTTEAAYNTDLRPLPSNDQDAKNDIHTRSLLLSALQVDLNGYYTFTLDVNEPNGGSQPAIDLTGLQVYLGTSGNEGPASISGLGNLVYDLGDNVVNMTDHGSGSGTADYQLKILKTAFDAQSAGGHSYVYLYSAFGSADGGFEEWAANTGESLPPPPPTAVPLPAAAWSGMGMLALLGAEGLRRKSRKVLA